MTTPHVYSAEMLAARWDCSAETIRQLYHQGRLQMARGCAEFEQIEGGK